MSKFKKASLAVIAALAFTLSSGTSPASAVGEGYVDADPGLNNGYENDWNDEGPIGYGNTTNVAGLWQWILWSDGYLRYTSDIDCVFGSGTQAATRQWNLDHSWGELDSGRAEVQSFANADNGLRFGGDYNSTLQYVYYGDSARPVTFLRGKSDHGAYYFRNPATGSWISAAYNNAEKANACG
ncbi:hypothetical protein [Streptomyces sp. NBC_01217]|uniref:hypothetical protein n=1 Tax=Streptomyces sp. NBC_01217 TaxID=2903779 RepID=UPI002E0F8046|nr:hypothetical protein OG507_38655 [Streptomyces sp. NBC_01217]